MSKNLPITLISSKHFEEQQNRCPCQLQITARRQFANGRNEATTLSTAAVHEPTLSFATEKILSSSSDQAEWAKVNLTIVKTQHDQLARISKASLNLSKIWKNQGFQLSIGQHNCDLPSQHRDSNLRFVCFTKCCCIIHFI